MSRGASRQPQPHPLGKCDTELKTQVPERMRDELTALATLRGQTLSEYVRDVFTRHLYGDLGALRMKERSPEGNGGIRAQ